MTAQEQLDFYQGQLPKNTRGLFYDDRRVRVLSVTGQRHTDMPAVIYKSEDHGGTGWCDADHFQKHFTPDT